MSRVRPEVWQRRGPTWEPGDRGGQEERGVVLDPQALQRVVAVGEPHPVGSRQDAEVDPAAPRRGALDLDHREGAAEPVQQCVGASRLCRVGYREHPVVVHLDVVDRVAGEERRHAPEDEVEHFGPRHVERHLPASERLVGGAEHPFRMGAVEVRLPADHLRLEPQAERHSEAPHVVDQRAEPFGVLPRVDLPIAERGRVVVASPEPAVVEHEALGPEPGRARGEVLEYPEVMVEVHRLPTVVVHRAGAAGPRELHDPVSHVALEGHRAAVETTLGPDHVERSGSKCVDAPASVSAAWPNWIWRRPSGSSSATIRCPPDQP